MATWRQSLGSLRLAHVAIFRGIGLTTQLLVCHEVAHVAIFVGSGWISSKRQDTTLVASGGMDEYAMYADLGTSALKGRRRKDE
jgi:hypothetical protein